MSTAIGAIARSEIARLFRQPFAWLVLALGEGTMAIVFMLFLVRYLEGPAELHDIGVTGAVLVPYFAMATLSVLFLTPILTMTTIAGDKRDGILRFLYSTPLATRSLVAGKLAGALSLAGIYVVLVAIVPLTLLWGAPIDLGVYVTNVSGLLLFTMMHNALGVMCSALTRAPIGAAIIALTLSLVLWSLAWAERLDGQSAGASSISTFKRMRGFSQGLVLSGDIVYFLVATIACIVIAIILVDADRKLT